MANGADSEEYVLCSGVRAGLKREFAFALKAQAEISGSLGRTRARKPINRGFSCGVSGNSSKKLKRSEKEEAKKEVKVAGDGFSTQGEALKSEFPSEDCEVGGIVEQEPDCISEEEPKSDVVDVACDDEPKTHPVVESVSPEGSVDSTGNDEPKTRMVECAIQEEQVIDNVTPIGAGEPKSAEATSGRGKDRTGETVEGTGREVTALVDTRVSVENAVVQMPLKQYIRAALKPKLKPMPVEDDMEEDTESIDIFQGEDSKMESVSGPPIAPPFRNQDVNMCNEAKLRKRPTKLKDLLDTGILEGLPVKYVRGSKVRAPNATGLRGVIKGSGILCFCGACMGTEVVTPTQFELHAGSLNKRPPDYIYLENGNTLRYVLNACKDSLLEALEKTIKNAIGCSTAIISTVCLHCKGSIPEAVTGNTVLLCGSCLKLKESQATKLKESQATKLKESQATKMKESLATPVKTTGSADRLMKSDSSSKASIIAQKSSSSQVKPHGKLTRKDLRLHKLVFEEDVLPDGTEVAYYARGQKLLVGYKKGFGILCTCCNSEVSPSQFESHAGWASRRKPYLHIYTSNGVSLHELSVSLSRGRRFSTNENDDLCSICADGGDLLCCDGCPRAFHRDCITLPDILGDTWFCKYCENMFQKERFVEHNANAVAAGRIAGVDPIEQITKRCIRIAQTPGDEFGCCALCRGHDFSRSGFCTRTVILCDQCEKEFHVGCLKEHNMVDLKELPKGQWFCCSGCSMIHSALEKLVINGEEKLSDSLLNVINTKREEKNLESNGILDIKWRILRGNMASDEMRPLLSKAVAIFHESFGPILESGTNRDFIPSMVYGRNMRDQEFGNMLCAVLTVNSLVVSAGLFRIFGQVVAELPLVATSSDCQGQGYFQCLFSCIERLLGSLGVQHLVLPAAEEAESIWTRKFGFNKVTKDELNGFMKDHPMMTFQGTPMLQKLVPNYSITDGS